MTDDRSVWCHSTVKSSDLSFDSGDSALVKEQLNIEQTRLMFTCYVLELEARPVSLA